MQAKSSSSKNKRRKAVVSGIGQINVPAAEVSAASKARQQLARARDLLRSVHLLATAPGDQVFACQFSAAWTLEFTLKAYLWHQRYTEEQLIGFGHKLETLWQEAASHGLAICATSPDWCRKLHALHTHPYHLRYATDIAGFVGPNIAQMTAKLQALFDDVESILQP
jgi:hypothetical protein